MFAALSYVSSVVAVIASALGFVALAIFTLVSIPVGAMICLYIGARGVFDETKVRRGHLKPTPI